MKAWLTRLWQTDPWLTGTGLLMAALALPFALGVALDPRVITGAPAWLKPLKFAVSIAIYALTLAWVFTFLPEWPRTRRLVGRASAVILGLEMVIIAGQAARGTTSHFNVAAALDATLFSIMGTAIVAQTVLSAAVAVALWRQRFADPALGWALRLGMILTIAGASTGGLMTRPTPAQLAEVRATGRMPVAGAHTVGAPDGGPGLPLTGWSTTHGDVRVAHFVGLHALQALPLFVLIALRGRSGPARVRATLAAAGVYALVFAGLVTQALRGLPVIPVG